MLRRQTVALLALVGIPGPILATDLSACLPLADDQQRLACYDRLAERQAPTVTTPEALFGLEPAAKTELLQRQHGGEPAEAIEQTVSTVSNWNGKLRLGLANGQEWAQTDSTPLQLKPGDVVRIRRAALGSYLLSRKSGGRGIRVRRVDEAARPD